MIFKTGQNLKIFFEVEANQKSAHASKKKVVSNCNHSVSAMSCPQPGTVCLNLKKGVKFAFKPGLRKLQMLVKRNVTLVSSIAVERRRCLLQVSSVAQLQENKET